MLVIKGITMGTTLTFNNTIILITTKLGVPKLKFYFHYSKEMWVYLSEPNAKPPLAWAFFSYHKDTLGYNIQAANMGVAWGRGYYSH